MTRYAIDAPTLLRLVDTGAKLDPAHQLVAPNAIRSELLQLLLNEVRAGVRSERDALAAHERATGVKIRLLGDRVSRATAWRIARERDWDTLRDAEHLAVARLQADALVTTDAALLAKAEGTVLTAPLESLLVPGPASTPTAG